MTETIERTEQEVNEALNDLLRRWHAHCLANSPGTGYPSVDSACRYSRTSRQYDYENGAMDASVDSKIMEGVDGVMWNIQQPYLTALQFQARNLFTGKHVWTSPRLPIDPQERAVILMEARNILLRGLAKAGVMN